MANSDIVLSSALRNNLLSLQGTQRSIDTTQLRLATGLKVNSALDNPQNFFTAKSLNNRAGDLQRLLDGIGQSIRTIEQANTGVETLNDLLDQAEAIALDAQSEVRSAEGFSRLRGTVDLRDATDLIADTDLENGDTFDLTVSDPDDPSGASNATVSITINNGDTVDNIVADINSDATINDKVRARVTGNGQLEIASLVDGASLRIEDNGGTFTSDDFSALGLDTVASQEEAGGVASFGGTSIAGDTLTSAVSAAPTVGGKYEASALLTDAAGGAGYIAAGGSVDLNLKIDGEVVNTGTISDTDTIQDVIDNINNGGNSDVTASFNVDTGQIELKFDDTVGQVQVEFDGTGPGGGTLGFTFGNSTQLDVATGANPTSENFTFDGVSAEVDQFQDDYNEIRTQIDDLIEDSNYRGINLLSGDNLTTYFNEDGNSSLETEGVDFSAIGLGITEADFTNANNVQQAIDKVRGAIDNVRTFGRSIANDLSVVQTRRDFTENTINTLKAGADDLTIADQNEEGANLLALQTRQTLGVTSLSLASQSQQAVLRLF